LKEIEFKNKAAKVEFNLSRFILLCKLCADQIKRDLFLAASFNDNSDCYIK